MPNRILSAGAICLLATTLILLHTPVLLGGTWQEVAPSGFRLGSMQGVRAEDDGLSLAYSSENLLQDPGFEAPPEKCPQIAHPYDKKPFPPRGWEHNGLEKENGAVRAASFVRSGQKAWELVDTMPRGEPALLQFVPFKPEYRGKRFAFEVWCRTREGANLQAMIALKYNSKTHWRSDVARAIVVEPEWRRYSIAAEIPADADELGVVIGPSSYEGQGAIIVDDAALTMIRYNQQGTYTSQPLDMNETASLIWRAGYRATIPQGATLTLRVRTGHTPVPDGSWSEWRNLSANPDSSLAFAPGRYAQYQAILSTSDPCRTPLLQDVRLDYGAHLGFISGRVFHERTGAPIAWAEVQLNGVITTTDASGKYMVGLRAGPFSGDASALRYLRFRVKGGSVQEGKRQQLDIPLQPDPSWPTFRGGPQRQGASALSGSLDGFDVAWRYPLGTVGGGQILPSDLDGDGVSEFVVARGGILSARRLNGELLWEVPDWEIGSIMGVYDLLGDGQRQVVGLSAGWQPYANGAFTVVNARDGKVLSRVDTWPDAGDIGHGDTKDYLHGSFSPLAASSCVVADLDRDGRLEIMVHPNYHSALMCFHFHDGLTQPKMMWKTQGRFKYDLYLYPLLSADVDGDGWLEIVFHDNDLIRLFDGRTGAEKSAADMGCPGGLFGHMACADVNGDGASEVLLVPSFKPQYGRNTIALAAWDGNALVKRWSHDFDETVIVRAFPTPLASPFAEADGDGRLEVVVQIGPDVVVLKSEDGTEKWRIPDATLHEAADLDADGVAEIIVRQKGKTLVFNGKGAFGPKPLTYPPNRGWHDWGAGELCQLRSTAQGQTEIVNQKGQLKGVLPGTPYMISPIVADLEGDGRMEILLRDAAGMVRILQAHKRTPVSLPIPETKCDSPGDISRGAGLSVCDLDGDARAEIIFRQEGHLTVCQNTGTVRFRSKQGGLRFPTVGRFNGDNVLDVACYADRKWIAFDGRDGSVIWEADAPESNEVAVWDVNGDGRDEIAGKHGPVFLINGANGKVLWTSFRREQCALGLGTFADLNGDGLMELLITGEYSNTAWYPDGKCMWWIGWSSGGAKEHYGALADVNGDGAQDLALSSNHGVLYCVDGRDGRELWTFAIPQKVSLSHCAVADLDGDRKPEFVFGSNTGRFFIVNGEDGSVAKSLAFRYPVGEPVVADVDADGKADVLVVSNGVLHCLSAGASN